MVMVAHPSDLNISEILNSLHLMMNLNVCLCEKTFEILVFSQFFRIINTILEERRLGT